MDSNRLSWILPAKEPLVCGYMMKGFYKAQILIRMFDDPKLKVTCQGRLVFYETDRPVMKTA